MRTPKHKEVISRIEGETASGKKISLVLGLRSGGKVFLQSEDRNNFVKESHVFSKNIFRQFFGSVLRTAYRQEQHSSEVMKDLDIETRVNFLNALIDSFSEENLQYVQNVCASLDSLISQGRTKPEYVNTKLEVLEVLRDYFSDRSFTAREFREIYPWHDKSSQRWLQRLKNQGFLNTDDADHEDGRVIYEYSLSKKSTSYLRVTRG